MKKMEREIERIGTDCCGCEACYNSCPVDAINIHEDTEGFFYPQIDGSKCIECGKCDKACPIISKSYLVNRVEKPEVFAAWNKNDQIRKKSSSGGVFTALARNAFSKKGIVIGASFEKGLNLIHKFAMDENELEGMRGSKYLQSRIGNCYKKAEMELKQGKLVMFTGTPCQINGLYNYLGKDYEKLITCDLVCHGVPSKKVFDKIIGYYENIHNSRVNMIDFRYKKDSWKRYNVKILFQNNKELSMQFNKEYFMNGFIQDLYLRPSCHKCKSVGIPRCGDLTLGDFWGIENVNPNIDYEKGVSLILVNSDKGRSFLNECLGEIESFESDLESALKGNPCIVKSVRPHKNREQFFRDLDSIKIDKLFGKYLHKKGMMARIRNKLTRLIHFTM